MKKLLHRTLRYYALYAVGMVCLITPFSYWLFQKIHLDDVDEAIWLRSREFDAQAQWAKLSEEDIGKWNDFNRDIKILPDTVQIEKGQIVQQVFYDALADEWEPYRVLYRNIPTATSPKVLMIRINLIESKDLLLASAEVVLCILLALLIGFLFLTRVISKKLWSPFYHSLDLLDAFDIEQTNKPAFSKTDIAEFHKLNVALERLIADNMKAFEREKEFTQNASHELQTPLAIFQSKLDMLLQSKDLTAEQAEILQELYAASARLLRINRNLLLLAKIEHKQFSEVETLSFKSIIEEALPYFQDQAFEKDLTINWVFGTEGVVNGSRGLCEILVNNLIMNAIRHNVRGGEVNISLQKGCLKIQNTGQVEALQGDEVFRRFSRGNKQAVSSGLGLAIVKKIARQYRWEIEYRFQDSQHTFSLFF
ncbi:HAMP domain-containing histidine kinase [Marinilongibacter aquaticus]|uniref:sensor histidine kinase n=1 Tax=Marinilongibacter aquaticus TaxID=2975157 RepID=UPI0021BD8ABC|nr:HAMP domain-containing sensor histidine kinase [Marinilongibacter aquaticus]UBM60739.1 HAMP domain-containing histidine kinase [Marinilongibacter aquaticus]